MLRALLLLAVIAATTALRRSPPAQRSDGYSKYEGQAMLRLETCTAAAAQNMSASAVAQGCRVFAEERLTPTRDGACGEAFAICQEAAAAQLMKIFGQHAHILHHDAGSYLREISGVPVKYHPLDTVSLVEGAQASGFYAEWQGLEAREVRIEAAVNASDGIAKIETAGESLEGRPIKLVRFTGNGYKPGMAKVVISYQVHAREWIAGMSGVYAVEKLAARVKEDPEWLAGMELVLVPLVNPDGYVHTIEKDRFHRKNMRMTSGLASVKKLFCDQGGDEGVDLNRNAPTDWGVAGEVDEDACGETFRGESVMSEPETQAIVKIIKEAPMSVYLDVHSFSQFVLGAWMYKLEEHPRKREFDTLGEKITAAIGASHNETYTYGQGSKLLYQAAGTLADYATSLGALGYVIELRPKPDGDGGFAPEKELILPTAEECYEGVLAAIQHAKEMPPPTGEQIAQK